MSVFKSVKLDILSWVIENTNVKMKKGGISGLRPGLRDFSEK
jgi:hypothetical protein